MVTARCNCAMQLGYPGYGDNVPPGNLHATTCPLFMREVPPCACGHLIEDHNADDQRGHPARCSKCVTCTGWTLTAGQKTPSESQGKWVWQPIPGAGAEIRSWEPALHDNDFIDGWLDAMKDTSDPRFALNIVPIIMGLRAEVERLQKLLQEWATTYQAWTVTNHHNAVEFKPQIDLAKEIAEYIINRYEDSVRSERAAVENKQYHTAIRHQAIQQGLVLAVIKSCRFLGKDYRTLEGEAPEPPARLDYKVMRGECPDCGFLPGQGHSTSCKKEA